MEMLNYHAIQLFAHSYLCGLVLFNFGFIELEHNGYVGFTAVCVL